MGGGVTQISTKNESHHKMTIQELESKVETIVKPGKTDAIDNK